jgi:hypothetical protein
LRREFANQVKGAALKHCPLAQILVTLRARAMNAGTAWRMAMIDAPGHAWLR